MGAIKILLGPILQKIRYRALLNKSIGEISLQESRFLGEIVKNLIGDGPIVEIGTHFGYSTMIMCLFKEPWRKLLTIDNYSWNSVGLPEINHFVVTQSLLKEGIEKFNIQVKRIDKDIFFEEFNVRPSLVFLDAIHEYEETKKDISWAIRVKAETICGHDYDIRYPGVIKAVEEFGGYRMKEETLWVL